MVAELTSGPRVRPPGESVFLPVSDGYGLRLALVFGNHAPEGRCPYYAANRCHHCDIGAGEGAAFDEATNLARLAWLLDEHHADVLKELAHVIIYNSGSTLNRRELPRVLLHRILERVGALPQLRLLSFDSREPYITTDVMLEIADRMGSCRVRPIIGLETADDTLRNEVLQKAMPRAAVERAFDAVARAAETIGSQRTGVDVNVVIGGPGTDDASAVEDALQTARYVYGLGDQRGLAVDLNLHPYYPSQRSSAQFRDHPRCSLKTAARAVLAMAGERDALAPTSKLFIGWQDEGHDTQQRERNDELTAAKGLFRRFNIGQDAACLAALIAAPST